MRDILLLLIGGFIGFASSYFQWKLTSQFEKGKIAHALFMEITSFEERLKVFQGMLLNPPPGFNKDNVMPPINQPFFNDSLFFSFKKEISSFNKNLSNCLYNFYIHLIRAEEYRQLNLSVTELPNIYKASHDEMEKNIVSAYELLPNAKRLLEKEFSKWLYWWHCR